MRWPVWVGIASVLAILSGVGLMVLREMPAPPAPAPTQIVAQPTSVPPVGSPLAKPSPQPSASPLPLAPVVAASPVASVSSVAVGAPPPGLPFAPRFFGSETVTMRQAAPFHEIRTMPDTHTDSLLIVTATVSQVTETPVAYLSLRCGGERGYLARIWPGPIVKLAWLEDLSRPGSEPIARKDEPNYRPDGWNTYALRCGGGRVELHINNVKAFEAAVDVPPGNHAIGVGAASGTAATAIFSETELRPMGDGELMTWVKEGLQIRVQPDLFTVLELMHIRGLRAPLERLSAAKATVRWDDSRQEPATRVTRDGADTTLTLSRFWMGTARTSVIAAWVAAGTVDLDGPLASGSLACYTRFSEQYSELARVWRSFWGNANFPHPATVDERNLNRVALEMTPGGNTLLQGRPLVEALRPGACG